MRKPTQPANVTPASQAAQPPPDAAASPEPAVSPIPAKLTPEGVGDWRSHAFFFWLGIVGVVGTLFFGVLSVYFYQASQIKPLLTFAVHPLKTELQRPDYDKELGFIYKGKPVDSESITSVQVSIWNAGTRSIRDSNVLDPFRLVMPDGSPILSVRAKKTSRPICGFEILGTQEEYKSGICPLKWRILEPGDGAVLQVIYAGNSRHDPKLMGSVEGQPNGTVIEEYSLNLQRTEIEHPLSIRMSRHWPIVLLFLIGLLLFGIAVTIHKQTEAGKKWSQETAAAAKHLTELRKKNVPIPPLVGVLFLVALFCIFAAFALFEFASSRPGPPFGW